MYMNKNIEDFLDIVKLGIGHYCYGYPKIAEWEELDALAAQQGLSAVLVDGIEKLPYSNRPPQELLLQWIGESLQGYEYRYDMYRKTIAQLAAFYNSHGLKMMVLKGYACSLDWTKPSHRPCGDIDIWLFGQQKKADYTLAKERGIKIDKGHYHHTIFECNGFTVENHYDFINVSKHTSHKGLELLFKELGNDDSNHVEILGERVYLPSPNLHALFLLRHALNHFASSGINLRQVLDWAFFVEKHSKDVDWIWLMSIVDKYRMRDFFNCINAICVENLGFAASLFPSVQYLPHLKEKIFYDIIYSAGQLELPDRFFSRQVYKYKRWKRNEWKRELCYAENGLAHFVSGVWAQLQKPKSI